MDDPRYRADSSELVRTVDLGGLTALYHLPSGITHLLAPPAPEILTALGSRPASPSALLSRLKRRYDLPAGKQALAQLQARLDELEAAGLVSRL